MSRSNLLISAALKPAASSSYFQTLDVAGSLPSGWSNQAGTPDWNYTANSIFGLSPSVRLNGSAATVSADGPTFTDRTVIYGYFVARFIAFGGAGREILRFQNDAGQSDASEIRVTNTGAIHIVYGTTASADSVATMSLDTDYHIFFALDAANTLGWVGFTTDGTIPTGNNLSTRNTMNPTESIDQFRLTAQFSTTGIDWVGNKFRFSDTAIGANPS